MGEKAKGEIMKPTARILNFMGKELKTTADVNEVTELDRARACGFTNIKKGPSLHQNGGKSSSDSVDRTVASTARSEASVSARFIQISNLSTNLRTSSR